MDSIYLHGSEDVARAASTMSGAAREMTQALAPVAAKPDPQPITAYRDRYCGRCGCREVQNYQGKITVTDDPHRVEGRPTPFEVPR